MEEYIFKDAKFGDKFLTKDGKRAIYFCCTQNAYEKSKKVHILVIEGVAAFFRYYDDGKIVEHTLSELASTQEYLNIVSKYTETIDANKLIELAGEYVEKERKCTRDVDWKVYNAYVAGYYKAQEE